MIRAGWFRNWTASLARTQERPERKRPGRNLLLDEIAGNLFSSVRAFLTQLNIPIESTTFPNGLRGVVSPDHAAPVATAGVYYNIAFRIEPRGRSVFAQLFGPMMFPWPGNAGERGA